MPAWWLLDYENSSEGSLPSVASSMDCACSHMKQAVQFALEGNLWSPNLGVVIQGAYPNIEAAATCLEQAIAVMKDPSAAYGSDQFMTPGVYKAPDKEKINLLASVWALLVGSMNYIGLINTDPTMGSPIFVASNVLKASLQLGCEPNLDLHKQVICGLLAHLKTGLQSNKSPDWIDSTLAHIKEILDLYNGWKMSADFLNFSAASASVADFQKFQQNLASFESSFNCSAPAEPTHKPLGLDKKIVAPVIGFGALLLVGLVIIGFVVQDNLKQNGPLVDNPVIELPITPVPSQPASSGGSNELLLDPAHTPTPTLTSGPVTAGGGSGLPIAACGDSVCDPAAENSDLCPADCQCVDDGVCSPGEGSSCRDCGSAAGTCGAACSDSSQCAGGLSCAGGVCWDACTCGGDCAGTTGTSGGAQGGSGGGPVCGVLDGICLIDCLDPDPDC